MKCGKIIDWYIVFRISLFVCFPFSYIRKHIIKCTFGSFNYILKLSTHLKGKHWIVYIMLFLQSDPVIFGTLIFKFFQYTNISF